MLSNSALCVVAKPPFENKSDQMTVSNDCGQTLRPPKLN
jgi:hypothetical protein